MSRIADIMNRQVETIAPTATVQEAAQKMRGLDLGSIPVCEDRKLLGWVTDREMTLRVAAEGRDPSRTPVRDIMNPDVPVCPEDADVEETTRAMRTKESHRVLVVDRENRLVGIVTLGQIARTGDEKTAGRVVKEISRPRRKSGTRRH